MIADGGGAYTVVRRRTVTRAATVSVAVNDPLVYLPFSQPANIQTVFSVPTLKWAS